MTPNEAIAHVKQQAAARGGKLPTEVFLMIWGRKGDPPNNAVARYFSEQGVKVYGVRADMAAFTIWLSWQYSLGKEFANMDEQQSGFRDYVFDCMPGNFDCGDGMLLKQVWKGNRWVDYHEKMSAELN